MVKNSIRFYRAKEAAGDLALRNEKNRNMWFPIWRRFRNFSEEKPREMCHIASRENSGGEGRESGTRRAGGWKRRGGNASTTVIARRQSRSYERRTEGPPERRRRTREDRESREGKKKEGKYRRTLFCHVTMHPAWPLFPRLFLSLVRLFLFSSLFGATRMFLGCMYVHTYRELHYDR